MLEELHSGYVFRSDLSIAPQGCREGGEMERVERGRGKSEKKKEEMMEGGPRDNSVFPRVLGPAA